MSDRYRLNQKLLAAEAERDTLAAEVARLRERVRDLEELLRTGIYGKVNMANSIRAEGAAAERASIVAWLQNLSDRSSDDPGLIVARHAIERGDHLRDAEERGE